MARRLAGGTTPTRSPTAPRPEACARRALAFGPVGVRDVAVRAGSVVGPTVERASEAVALDPAADTDVGTEVRAVRLVAGHLALRWSRRQHEVGAEVMPGDDFVGRHLARHRHLEPAVRHREGESRHAQLLSSRCRTLPTSLRGSTATTSKRTGTLYASQMPAAVRVQDALVEGASYLRSARCRARRTPTAPRPDVRRRTPTTAASRTCGMQTKHLLDLGGEHLQATPVHHVGHSALDPDEPVVVDVRDVSGPLELAPPIAWRVHPAARRLVDAHLDTVVGAADRAQLGVAVLARVRCAPADDLAAELRLPVAVQHGNAELVAEASGLERRQRRGDAADDAKRREVGDRSSSQSIVIAAGGSTTERTSNRRTSAGELRRWRTPP